MNFSSVVVLFDFLKIYDNDDVNNDDDDDDSSGHNGYSVFFWVMMNGFDGWMNVAK